MLWKGQVLWGAMVYDNLRALDYLITRSDVDGERIGTMGLSMGEPHGLVGCRVGYPGQNMCGYLLSDGL